MSQYIRIGKWRPREQTYSNRVVSNLLMNTSSTASTVVSSVPTQNVNSNIFKMRSRVSSNIAQKDGIFVHSAISNSELKNSSSTTQHTSSSSTTQHTSSSSTTQHTSSSSTTQHTSSSSTTQQTSSSSTTHRTSRLSTLQRMSRSPRTTFVHSLKSSSSLSSTSFSVRNRTAVNNRRRISEFPCDHISNSKLNHIVSQLKQQQSSLLKEWTSSHSSSLTRYTELNNMMIQREEEEIEKEKEESSESPMPSVDTSQNPLKTSLRKRIFSDSLISQREEEEKKRNERLEKLFQSLVFFSPNETVCDGCAEGSSTKQQNLPPAKGIHLYVEGKECKQLKNNVYYSEDSPLEITTIYVSMMNRINHLQQLLYRWHGSIRLFSLHF